jgi:Ca-activated chloride channel family protein
MSGSARIVVVTTFGIALCCTLFSAPGRRWWASPAGAASPAQPTAVEPPAASGKTALPQSTPRAATGNSTGTSRADVTDGALALPDGQFCPLTHTDVQGELSGLLARVKVTQEFVNPTSDRVEAVYTFPLPQHAAVDDLTMTVGDRTVRGLIKKRQEAREIYERAREAGQTAALLQQERPNIFTQAVANIPPNGRVIIEIAYVETLDYDEGRYAFAFPMVVGPRYIPGEPTGSGSGGWSPDTTVVPDGSRITPPVAGVHFGKKGSRAGHDISVALTVDAGVPMHDIRSTTHEIDASQPTPSTALIRLKRQQEIPNRDFVITYRTASGRIEDAVIAHAPDPTPGGPAGGYFTLILQPPDRMKDEDVTSRELVFVLDTSGSMSGYPIETAKAVMRRAIRSVRAGDTFNVITFAGDTRVLFPKPVDATVVNVERALEFIDGQAGGGGTEMMNAIRIALGDATVTEGCASDGSCDDLPHSSTGAIRIVCFLTDGYVGNDMEILGEIRKRPAARVFSLGIGSSVNRFLLDGMARAGRGEVEYVLRAEDAKRSADRFFERVHTPVLTDISIDWGSLPITQLTPARTPDLFTARPLVIAGRYASAANGMITLKGLRGGQPFSRQIRVSLPKREARNSAVARLWARRQIEDLMAKDWNGMQQMQVAPELEEQITALGLQYRLVTQFTAFVAVEEKTIVEGGQQRTIQVPVEMPRNVSPEGVFGEPQQSAGLGGGFRNKVASLGSALVSPSAPPPPSPRSSPASTAESAPVREDRREAQRDEKEHTLASKVHPALAQLLSCVKGVSDPKRLTACGVDPDGRIGVNVWLDRNSMPELLQRLVRAGLILDTSQGTADPRRVTGRIAPERVAALLAIPEVRLLGLAPRP